MRRKMSHPRLAECADASLIRSGPIWIYFARVRLGGKLIRRSLKTNALSVARLRLADFVREHRERIEARASAGLPSSLCRSP
jgi:hypothetical protein